MNKKRLMSLTLVLVMMIGLVPTTAQAADEVTSGTCGNNLTWVLDEDGTLTISGTGSMFNFKDLAGNNSFKGGSTVNPWYNKPISKVIIEDGITSIGNYAFQYCKSVQSISIPSSVTSIGGEAFGCSSVYQIIIPGSCKVSNGAFILADITNVVLSEGITSLPRMAFYGCHIQQLYLPTSIKALGDYALSGCEVSEVYYSGSEAEYNSSCFRGHFSTATIHYNATPTITTTASDPYTVEGGGSGGAQSGLDLSTIPDSDQTTLKVDGTTHLYVVLDQTMSWSEAKACCENLGGHLATITSEEEQQAVLSILDEKQDIKGYWLGGYKDSEWKWVTGEPFSYANWDYDQPDGEDNMVLQMFSPGYRYGNAYRWDDTYNAGSPGGGIEQQGVLCEWDDAVTTTSFATVVKYIEGVPNIVDGTTPSSWAAAEVGAAQGNGLVPSALDGDYTANITRAQFCQLCVDLVDSLGMRNSVILIMPDVPGSQETQFSDTSDQDVIDMANAGVVTGYGDGRFGPDDPITREQAAVMLTRLAKKLGCKSSSSVSLSQFSDESAISDWARDGVAYIAGCKANGKAVMGGTGSGFSPQATYTREQAFISFERLYEAVTAPAASSSSNSNSSSSSSAGQSSANAGTEAWEDTSSGELSLAKSAKSLVAKLTQQANEKDDSGVDTEKLAALKEQISVSWPCYHSYHAEAEVPDAVYEAFARAILDDLDASNIDALESDPTKLTNQIYNSIKSGFSNDSVTVTVDGTAYRVDYNISGMSFLGIGAQVSSATVKWSNHEALLVSTSTSEDMKEALAAFCSTLAELNTEVWKEFMAAYVADAFGLMDIKSVTQKTVKEVLDKAEKVILALTDKDAADALLELAKDELSAEVQAQLKSGWLKNNFAEFIQDNVPYGEQIVKGADLYETAKAKYDKWAALVDTGVNGSDKEKAETLYNEFQSAMTNLDNVLNAIP